MKVKLMVNSRSHGPSSLIALAHITPLFSYVIEHPTGLPRSGTNQGKEIFSRSGKSQGVREILNSCKSVIRNINFRTLLCKVSSWMVSENWYVVSEKSGECQGIFSILVSGNPDPNL